MVADEIRKLLRADPFTPFEVHLADGKVLHVPHGDYAALTPNNAVLYVFQMVGGTNRVVVSHITKLATANEAELPG